MQELLALEEQIGDVSTGLSEEAIAKCLKTRSLTGSKSFSPNDSSRTEKLDETCSVCQVYSRESFFVPKFIYFNFITSAWACENCKYDLMSSPCELDVCGTYCVRFCLANSYHFQFVYISVLCWYHGCHYNHTFFQVQFEENEMIGTLNCGHEYHAECIRKWLRLKNFCPVCKASAAPSNNGWINIDGFWPTSYIYVCFKPSVYKDDDRRR